MTLPATLNEYALESSSLDELANQATDLLAQFDRAPEVVENDKIYGAYGDLVKLLRSCWKEFDERRKKRTKPLDDTKELIMADFKPWTMRLALAGDTCKKRQGIYDDKRETERIEEENRIQKERDDQALTAAKALQDAGKPVEAEAVIEKAAAAPVLDTTPERVRGKWGSVTSSRKEHSFSVVSLRELPDHLVAVIEANDKAMDAIRIAIKDEVMPIIRAGTKQAPTVIQGLEIRYGRSPTTR